MNPLLRFLGSSFTSLVLPRECVGCGEFGTVLCDPCKNHIPLRTDFLCPGCWQPSLTGETHERCRSHSSLDGILIVIQRPAPSGVKHALQALKYEGTTQLAPFFALLVYQKIISSSFFFQEWVDSETILIPVPLHPRKLYVRNFNQSTLIAQNLAQLLPLTIQTDIVVKYRFTRAQTNRTKRERLTQQSDSFQVPHPLTVSGKQFLVFDDVVTTGATLQEVARVLRAAGARAVWGMALAHG